MNKILRVTVQCCCYYWAVFAGLQLLPAPACEKLLIFLFLSAVPESSGQPSQQIWHQVKRTIQYAPLFQEELPSCIVWSQRAQEVSSNHAGLYCTVLEVLFILDGITHLLLERILVVSLSYDLIQF